jgi:hypothetical protein
LIQEVELKVPPGGFRGKTIIRGFEVASKPKARELTYFPKAGRNLTSGKDKFYGLPYCWQ